MKPLVITFEFENPDTEESSEVELPAKFVVCSRCEGHGSHVNPSIDDNGITADEWNGPDWDDESKEQYMNGGYDVPCEECGGERLVRVVDDDAVKNGSDEVKAWAAAYYKEQREAREDRATERAERRMGY